MDPIPTNPALQHKYTVTCVDYHSTSSKSFTDDNNRIAIADAIDQALQLLRDAGTAATRVDVIGHGMGGLLARRYIDEPSFVRFDNFNAGGINRLITVNTPNLGARLADEMIRVRNTMKQDDAQNGTQTWLNLKTTTLEPVAVLFDDADQDVALQEMGASSAIVNGIGAAPARPSTVAYHAVFSPNGHALKRIEAFGLLAGGVAGGIKNYSITMESRHPSSRSLSPTARRSLITDWTIQRPASSSATAIRHLSPTSTTCSRPPRSSGAGWIRSSPARCTTARRSSPRGRRSRRTCAPARR